jgi:3'5'-cyclic nucleotide phosphodiesterase
MTLVNEKDPLAAKYNCKSVAEQNSMELSWQVFMEPKYKELRDFICPTPEELAHLRQILINVVMATGKSLHSPCVVDLSGNISIPKLSLLSQTLRTVNWHKCARIAGRKPLALTVTALVFRPEKVGTLKTSTARPVSCWST